MAYGTQQEVASLAKVWTDAGVWKNPNEAYDLPGTNPSLDQVDIWLDEVSAQMNVALGNSWFVVPIDPVTSPNVHKAISLYVVSLVADLCHFVNSSGRFFTDRLVNAGITPIAAIMSDINKWVEMNADGLVADNVPQNQSTSAKKQPFLKVIGFP